MDLMFQPVANQNVSTQSPTPSTSLSQSVVCRFAVSHLSLVLRLQPQPGLDAAPRLQEGLALSPVRQVADEDAGGVHAHEEHGLSCDLETRTHSGSDL